jgi:hypothetical protein
MSIIQGENGDVTVAVQGMTVTTGLFVLMLALTTMEMVRLGVGRPGDFNFSFTDDERQTLGDVAMAMGKNLDGASGDYR